MVNNYLSVVYNPKLAPYTDYPSKLCSYLFQVFNFKKGMKMLEPGCGRGEFLSNFQKDLAHEILHRQNGEKNMELLEECALYYQTFTFICARD